MLRAIDENTITDAAIEQMAATPNPRLKQIMEPLVRHLHAWAREADLTPEEWLQGISFLTAVGPEMHGVPAGVYPPFRHAGAELADHLSSRQARSGSRHQEQPGGSVLSHGFARDEAGRYHRTKPSNGLEWFSTDA
jgi:hypothetical protein